MIKDLSLRDTNIMEAIQAFMFTQTVSAVGSKPAHRVLMSPYEFRL